MASSRPDNNELIDDSTRGSRSIIRLLSVVTVLGVLVGVAGLLAPKVFSYADSSEAGERKAIVSRTTDFAVAYNTYDVAKVDDYQARMKGLLSKKYNAEFVKVTDSIFKALDTKKQVSKGAKVLDVAVDSVDKDSAIALVAVDASITNTDVDAAVARHLRWKVTLVKQGDEWNVDTFESVATASATAGEPTPKPSAEPSEGSDK